MKICGYFGLCYEFMYWQDRQRKLHEEQRNLIQQQAQAKVLMLRHGDELARKRMQVGITSHSYFGESFRTYLKPFLHFQLPYEKKCLASAVNATELLRLRSTSIFYKNAEHSDLHI